MSEETANQRTGKFVWYEWMGDDIDAAAAFYAQVLGWNVKDGGMTGLCVQDRRRRRLRRRRPDEDPGRSQGDGRAALLDRLHLGSRRRRGGGRS